MNIQRNAAAKWCGIVMIIRPDPTKLSEGEKPLAWVCSKRDLLLNGRRAISEQMPLEMLAHYFQAGDGDAVEVYAEFTARPNGAPGHLEFYEKASKAEFFKVEPVATNPVPVPAH